MFMKRLFGGATLLCAACSAHAGLIQADFRTDVRTGAGLPGYGSWDSGEAWLGLDPAPNTLPLQAQDHVDFQAFGTTVTGITFLTETPAANATPNPEPATLALFGLGAGALGLARQGKGKRA
jgi:hypothetical protein